jgi:excisionase family DNA binding protein
MSKTADRPKPSLATAVERRLLTAEEAGEVLRISRTRVYELIYAGELRSIKIGRLRRITVAAIEEFIERMTDAA